jgi:hypothetical protein
MASPGLNGIPPLKFLGVGLISLTSVVPFVGYGVYLQSNRPHSIDRAAGFVHPMTMRGGVTSYFSQTDFIVMGALFVVAALGVGGAQFYFWRLRRQHGPK